MSGENQSLTATVTIAAGGTGVATIRCPSTIRKWVVRQVSVQNSTAPVGASCLLKLNGYLVTPIIATGDAASGDPPIVLRSQADALTVEFAGCTPGNVAQVLVLYDEVQGSR